METLPQEIIDNISTRLLPDDVLALRASCKTLQQRCSREFINRFFTAKCIHFTKDSLASLLAISEQEQLTHKLKTVYIHTKYFHNDIIGCRCGDPQCDGWTPSVFVEEGHRAYAMEQKALRTKKQDLTMLIQTFRRLKHLETVILIDHLSCLDEGVDYRGLHRSLRRAGDRSMPPDPAPVGSYQDWFDHIFVVALKAIKQSRVQVKAFKMQFSEPARAIMDTTLCLVHNGQLALEQSKFTSITALQLNITYATQRVVIAEAMALFPKLTNLALSFDPDLAGEADDTCPMILRKINLSKIKTLSLTSINVVDMKLMAFLRKLKNIQVLKLEYINLVTISWTDVLAHLQGHAKLVHLHIIRPSRRFKSIFFWPNAADSSSTELRFKNPKQQPPTLAQYQDSFTRGTFHPCDENIYRQVPRACLAAQKKRGNYICLRTQAEIRRFVPLFMEHYHVSSHDDDFLINYTTDDDEAFDNSDF